MNNHVNIYNKNNYDLASFEKVANMILDRTLSETKNQSKNTAVSVIFTDKEESLKLNQQYRKKDYVPDVLSFDGKQIFGFADDTNDLGDIFICYAIACEHAKDFEHSLFREISFLFLHGLLHNLNYDHQTKDEEEVMFSLQKKILQKLNIKRTTLANEKDANYGPK